MIISIFAIFKMKMILIDCNQCSSVKVTNLNKKITQYPINKGVAFFYAL